MYLASEADAITSGCVLFVTYPNSCRCQATITMGMEIERALPLLNQYSSNHGGYRTVAERQIRVDGRAQSLAHIEILQILGDAIKEKEIKKDLN